MNKNYEIIIDTFGSDRGLPMILKGSKLLLEKYPSIKIVLVGKEIDIKEEMNKNDIDINRIRIINADEVITNYDDVIRAFFDKPNSSILLALKELSENPNAIGLLSAGNSGAIMLGAMKYLKDDDNRPCLGAILPNEKKEFTCLVDVGASIDCSPSQLHHFAILGSDIMRKLYKIDSPRIGLLSNGVEPTKGNKLVKEAHRILKEDKSLNFIGNIEGNRSLSGDCDVLVADGFDANQVLKVTEGTAKRMIDEIVNFAKDKDDENLTSLIKYLSGIYDISSLGGAILLGCKKTVIKCRGNSSPNTILNTGTMLMNLFTNEYIYKY